MSSCKVNKRDPYDWENKFKFVLQEDSRLKEPKILVARITEKLVPAANNTIHIEHTVVRRSKINRSTSKTLERTRQVYCGNASMSSRREQNDGDVMKIVDVSGSGMTWTRASCETEKPSRRNRG